MVVKELSKGMTQAQVFSGIVLLLLGLIVLAAGLGSGPDGPRRRPVKVRIRTDSERDRTPPPEDDLPLAEQLDRLLVWAAILLGFTLLVRWLAA